MINQNNFHPTPLEAVQLFIFDLDGTALGGTVPYVRFPDPFSDFLDELDRNGCHWAINTTWDPHGQWELVGQSRVKSRPLFYMGEYGLRLAEHGPHDAVPIIEYNEINEERLREVRARCMDSLFKKAVATLDIERVHHYGHTFSIKVPPHRVDTVVDFVAARSPENPELEIRCKNGSLAVKPAFLNKGLPVQEAIRRTGISAEAILTAGDEPADIAMMSKECSARCVCPANAAEAVKEHIRLRDGRIGNQPFSAGVIEAFLDYGVAARAF